MKKLLIILAIISAIVFASFIFRHCNKPKNELKAPDSWFAQDFTQAPSDIKPFTDKSVSDTAFHFWSWQRFLSLTRGVAGANAPFENLIQVDNYSNPIGKIIELNDSTQAGSDAVLYDRSSRAIYYTIHQNQIMQDFQKAYIQIFASIITKYSNSPNRNVLVQKELNELGYDTLNFPVGALLVKTSWILASSLSQNELKNYYVTDGVMPTSHGNDTVKIALLGMHIVESLKNHPELIWATYEKIELAPNYKWSHEGYPDMGEIISNKNFLFYDSLTNVNSCPMNNMPCSSPGFNSVFTIYPFGMVRSFTSTGYPDKTDLANNENVISLAKSVRKHLDDKGEVWKNYYYKGSVWLNAVNSTFKPGNQNIGSLSNRSLKGTRAISNISMETYTQLLFTGNYTQGSMNCFGCHMPADFMNANNNGSLSYNLSISHSFRNGLFKRVSEMAKAKSDSIK